MAILKIKDENGEFINIPSIIGKQGPQGEQGPKGEKGDPGETQDLSNYATKEEVNNLIGNINNELATLTTIEEAE